MDGRQEPGAITPVSGLRSPVLKMPDIAVYPGSFDPITNGHLDLIQRALKIFDHINMAVATNAFKKSLFTIEERVEMARESLKEYPNVSVSSFQGLLVKYAREQKARAILRGLRAVTDFEYEFQLAMMNRQPGTGDRDGLFDDRAPLGFSLLQHPQGGGGARRRHRGHGAGDRL